MCALCSHTKKGIGCAYVGMGDDLCWERLGVWRVYMNGCEERDSVGCVSVSFSRGEVAHDMTYDCQKGCNSNHNCQDITHPTKLGRNIQW